jgi:hypothetical protein
MKSNMPTQLKYKKPSGKKTSGKKTSGKKTSGKKTSGKKTSGKKPSGKKPSSKKPSSKKPSSKKHSGKKTSGKKTGLTGGSSEIYKKIFKDRHDLKNAIKLMENTFNKKYKPCITIDDIDNELPYLHGDNCKTNLGLHIGQRKLLLSEVQFLTNNTQKYCIYPGSAPSHKTHFLANLFPDVKLILIDPNIFEIKLVDNGDLFRKRKHPDIIMLYNGFPTKSLTYGTNTLPEKMTKSEISDMLSYIENSNHKIYIIEDYMTDNLALILKQLGKCNFISDIRSNVTNTSPVDFDIIWNRSMVHNWINILQPEISMVKFRIPYYNSKEDFNDYPFANEHFETSKKFGVDFVNNYNNKIFSMSKAKLYLQAWSGQTSTEMRGWIEKKDISNIITYDITKIESKLFYYNKVTRCAYHTNVHANKKIHLCNCNDCAIESTIWDNYINLIYLNQPKRQIQAQKSRVEYYIKLTNILTSRSLVDKHNNTIYEPLTLEILKDMLNKKNNSTAYGHKVNRGNTGIRK